MIEIVIAHLIISWKHVKMPELVRNSNFYALLLLLLPLPLPDSGTHFNNFCDVNAKGSQEKDKKVTEKNNTRKHQQFLMLCPTNNSAYHFFLVIIELVCDRHGYVLKKFNR